jgi:hypothetical protein
MTSQGDSNDPPFQEKQKLLDAALRVAESRQALLEPVRSTLEKEQTSMHSMLETVNSLIPNLPTDKVRHETRGKEQIDVAASLVEPADYDSKCCAPPYALQMLDKLQKEADALRLSLAQANSQLDESCVELQHLRSICSDIRSFLLQTATRQSSLEQAASTDAEKRLAFVRYFQTCR